MDERDTRHNRSKKRKNKKNRTGFIALILALIAIFIGGGIILYDKISPTSEHMELSEYFVLSRDDEAAVILNGEYDADEEHAVEAIVAPGGTYIELNYLKGNIDDGYVYDDEGGILRYVTEQSVITAGFGTGVYSVGEDTNDLGADVMLSDQGFVYINTDFVALFTDITHYTVFAPYRLIIETAGTEKSVATLKKDTAIRKLGGPKSKILKDALKDERVWIKQRLERWSKVVTEDGVIGYLENNRLNSEEQTIVASRIPERDFTHNLLPEKVKMGWHHVYNSASNSGVSNLLDTANGLNVISPTWYRIADNDGNIDSMASAEYVNACHSRGVYVWAMVSNFDVPGVDSTIVLNRTASRDNLVNRIIGNALADHVDGINIDFEALSINAKDGFIEFIKEISLKCKANNLVLSVVNYKPEAHTMFYNRTVQSQYADYVIVIAYDEHHSESETPGSNSSYTFAEAAVMDTLGEVPPEQLILALPFYTRFWYTDANGFSNKSVGMLEAQRQVEANEAEKVWMPEEQQYYATFESEGRKAEVWLEDEQSLSAKISLAKENDLAGVAFWRLGFEASSMWTVINGYIY